MFTHVLLLVFCGTVLDDQQCAVEEKHSGFVIQQPGFQLQLCQQLHEFGQITSPLNFSIIIGEMGV